MRWVYPLVFAAGAMVSACSVGYVTAIGSNSTLLAASFNAASVAFAVVPNVWAAKQASRTFVYVALYVAGQFVGVYVKMGTSTGVWGW